MYDMKALYEASSVENAVALRLEHPEAQIIAGGSDVLVQMREGKRAGAELISIYGLDELRGITIDADENIRIGSLTSFSHITRDPIIQQYINVLGEAVDMVGGPQIRNIGTIGGNTCNGVTSADSSSTLHAWDAIVELTGKNGVRRLPIHEFYIKAGKVDIRVEDGEIQTAILIPKESYDRCWGHYIKYAMRNAMDIATLGCSVNVRLSEDKKTIQRARIAYGVAGPVPLRCATAEAAGVPFYTDPAQMMDEVKPEAVIIATPNDLHLGVAREAVKRNIVPLIEKPISNDLEDAQAFAAEAETAGVPVLVGQHRRHNPFVNKAKEIIESGELGKLTVSSFHYMIYKNDEYFDVEWRRKKGAGPILVNLVHDVDLLRYLLGEPVAVQGMQSSAARGFETEDSAVVNVRFADGALASMTISDATASPWNWEATAREDPQYRPFDADAYFIGGTKGALSLPRLHQFSYDGASNWHKPLQMEIPAVDPALPHKMQLKHFVKVVRREVEPVVTPADNVKTLTLLNAIKEAAETGQLVEL